MLEHTPPSEHHFLLRKPDDSTYTARDICFADDLQSFSATLEGLQRTADLVSTYAMVFNLSILPLPHSARFTSGDYSSLPWSRCTF